MIRVGNINRLHVHKEIYIEHILHYRGRIVNIESFWILGFSETSILKYCSLKPNKKKIKNNKPGFSSLRYYLKHSWRDVMKGLQNCLDFIINTNK